MSVFLFCKEIYDSFFFTERSHNALVDGVFGYDVVNDHGIGGLSLPPQAGVGLLVEFQRPGQPEPDEGRAACL